MFSVGQKVVCIREPIPGHGCPYPIFKKGSVYTVASIEVIDEGSFISVVELHPLVTGEISGFRPIVSRKTSIEIFKAMLNPSPVTVDADRVQEQV